MAGPSDLECRTQAETSFHEILAQAAAEYDSLRGRYWAVVWENSRLKEELAAGLSRERSSAPSDTGHAWQTPDGDLGALRVSPSVASVLRTRRPRGARLSAPARPTADPDGAAPPTPVAASGGRAACSGARGAAAARPARQLASGGHSQRDAEAVLEEPGAEPEERSRLEGRPPAEEATAEACGQGALPHSETWLPCSPPLTSRASSPASPRRGNEVLQAGQVVDIWMTPLLGHPADEAVVESDTPRLEGREARLVLADYVPASNEASYFAEDAPRSANLSAGANSPPTVIRQSPIILPESGLEGTGDIIRLPYSQDVFATGLLARCEASLNTDDHVGPGSLAMKVAQFTATHLEVLPQRIRAGREAETMEVSGAAVEVAAAAGTAAAEEAEIMEAAGPLETAAAEVALEATLEATSEAADSPPQRMPGAWARAVPGARGFAPRALVALAEGRPSALAEGGHRQWVSGDVSSDGWAGSFHSISFRSLESQ